MTVISESDTENETQELTLDDAIFEVGSEEDMVERLTTICQE